MLHINLEDDKNVNKEPETTEADIKEEVNGEFETVEVEDSESKLDRDSSYSDDGAVSIGFENKNINFKHISDLLHPEITDKIPKQIKNIDFPDSYFENSAKEWRVNAYAHNFQRQYAILCNDRTKLYLTPENEVGVEKFICTTLRKTRLPYPEFYYWQGCAKFVCEYLRYQPLSPANEPPKRLISPSTTVELQIGTSFEFSMLLCSLLLGANYDAYVVYGYATKEVCLNDLTRTECPYIEVVEEEKEVVEKITPGKYIIKPPRDLGSKYEIYLEANRIKKELEIKKKEQKNREKLEAELDKPPNDLLFGLRVHSWVLVLPGMREVSEPFFIESVTGLSVPVNSMNYLGIESVWNDNNYWVNMQDCSSGISNLKYDLNDCVYWEYLMPYGSIHNKITPPSNETTNKAGTVWSNITSTVDYDLGAKREQGQEDAITAPNSQVRKKIFIKETLSGKIRQKTNPKLEDHLLLLDLPASWTNPIEVSEACRRKQFPNFETQRKYKKTIVEMFSEYSNPYGIVKIIKVHSDREYTDLIEVITHYRHRMDNLIKRVHDPKTNWTVDEFEFGDLGNQLKSSGYLMNDRQFASTKWNMTFFKDVRVDGLVKREFNNMVMKEVYDGRDDGLTDRITAFGKESRGDTGSLVRFVRLDGVTKANEKIFYDIESITEHYARNEKIPADEDIYEKKFNLLEGRITLTYHYGPYRIVRSTREFLKTNVFDERHPRNQNQSYMHTSFILDPNVKAESNVFLFKMYKKLLEEELQSQTEVRKSEAEAKRIIALRLKEELSKELETHLFDTLRIKDAHERRLMLEKDAEEEKFRVQEEDLDYLEPYIYRLNIPDANNLTKEQAFAIREECLKDFKEHLITKANIIQARFERETEALQRKQQWYHLNQMSLRKIDEEEYLKFCDDTMFKIHTLDAMLARHKTLAPQKYMALEKKLSSDTRLLDCTLNAV